MAAPSLPAPFALERYFARHEFSARYLLSASDCQGPSMAALLEMADPALRSRWDRLTLGYTESRGLPELREAIAETYRPDGALPADGASPAGDAGAPAVTADQILVAAPEEAIFLAMHALLSPGDHVVCTFPGYQSLYELARSIGCEVDLWEPEEDAGWRFDPAALKALLRPTTRLVVCNFPHNPTGALPSAEDFESMVEAVARTGAWLFSDEMYRLLEPIYGWRLPPAVNLYERAISLAGMSKAYGLAGLRIGWAAVRDADVLERMKALKDYTTICSSAPSELLSLMALRSAAYLLADNRALIDRNRTAAAHFFEQHSDLFDWTPPRAGTVCFPRLRRGSGPTSLGASAAPSAEVFCAVVLAETGALLLPSTVYGYGESHFRLGLGRRDFSEGLDVLVGFLTGLESGTYHAGR